MTKAEETSKAPLRITPRRVLIADDSSITLDLFKLILSQRGHTVTIVTNGRTALKELQTQTYDVALIDFHLPDLNGLDVATTYLETSAPTRRPRLIAVTADVEGLLAHPANAGKFCAIVPKPVDMQDMCRVVEEGADPTRGTTSETTSANPASSVSALASITAENVMPFQRPKVRPTARTGQPPAGTATGSSHVLCLDFRYLIWPQDFTPQHLASLDLTAVNVFDAIVVQGRPSKADLAALWQVPGLHLLPVIDLTGHLGKISDLDASKLGLDRIGQVREVIRAFRARREKIQPDLQASSDLGEKLLGRLFVSNRSLGPRYDSSEKSLVSYNCLLPTQTVLDISEQLTVLGYVTPRFFDNFYVCEHCDSSLIHVRRECPSCRSPHLLEERLIVHETCGCRGPESQFWHGDRVTCPFCHVDLPFPKEGEAQPATVLVCATCGEVPDTPASGFVCISCGSQMQEDTVKNREIFSFVLSDRGKHLLAMGRANQEQRAFALPLADLPQDFIHHLNEEARRFNDTGQPFALVRLTYAGSPQEGDSTSFWRARQTFLQNLQGLLLSDMFLAPNLMAPATGSQTAATGKPKLPPSEHDFLLLKATPPGTAQQRLAPLLAKAQQDLAGFALPEMKIIGPEDFT